MATIQRCRHADFYRSRNADSEVLAQPAARDFDHSAYRKVSRNQAHFGPFARIDRGAAARFGPRSTGEPATAETGLSVAKAPGVRIERAHGGRAVASEVNP